MIERLVGERGKGVVGVEEKDLVKQGLGQDWAFSISRI